MKASNLQGTSFPLADANGNCVSFIDNAGKVQAHYTYDAFGNTVSQTGAMADDFPFRFSSKYLDDETGLYCYGYRWYSPALGRWLSRDPIENLADELIQNRVSPKKIFRLTSVAIMNLYAFLSNAAMLPATDDELQAFAASSISCFLLQKLKAQQRNHPQAARTNFRAISTSAGGTSRAGSKTLIMRSSA